MFEKFWHKKDHFGAEVKPQRNPLGACSTLSHLPLHSARFGAELSDKIATDALVTFQEIQMVRKQHIAVPQITTWCGRSILMEAK